MRKCTDCQYGHLDDDGDLLCLAVTIEGGQFPGDDDQPWAAFAEDLRQPGARCGPDARLFVARVLQ